MEQLTRSSPDEALWYMMYADDVVLVDNNTNESDGELKRVKCCGEKQIENI